MCPSVLDLPSEVTRLIFGHLAVLRTPVHIFGHDEDNGVLIVKPRNVSSNYLDNNMCRCLGSEDVDDMEVSNHTKEDFAAAMSLLHVPQCVRKETLDQLCASNVVYFNEVSDLYYFCKRFTVSASKICCLKLIQTISYETKDIKLPEYTLKIRSALTALKNLCIFFHVRRIDVETVVSEDAPFKHYYRLAFPPPGFRNLETFECTALSNHQARTERDAAVIERAMAKMKVVFARAYEDFDSVLVDVPDRETRVWRLAHRCGRAIVLDDETNTG